MKKIFLLPLLILLSMYLNAQADYSVYKKSKKQFEGKWIGIINKDSLTIKLIATPTYLDSIEPTTDSIAILCGWHEIVQNGKKIESDLDSLSRNIKNGCSITMLYTLNDKEFILSLKDFTRNKFLSGKIIKLSNDKILLTTWLKEPHNFYDNKEYPSGQTYPVSIKMKRVSKKID